MSHILALPNGTVLADDYRIERVLGAGGFGITYLADEQALGRLVTIKEYFPADFAHRLDSREAVPRSEGAREDYQWGLDRFISEAQTLARFDHPNIVKVYRYFQAHSTAYMVLQFEEGQSLKGWLKSLGRAPRQHELDAILMPLLEALDTIHSADFLHRDIAPDNIIIRKDGSPVLIDFGSARGEIAQHSRTLSALVKPGYSPYEQYAETGHRQGPWTDIYALAATLYHAVTGKRPPDAPSRVVKDTIAPTREVALSAYRAGFLAAIDRALSIDIDRRPASVKIWRGELLAPDQKPPRAGWLKRAAVPDTEPAPVKTRPLGDIVPPAPDAPGQHGGFLDFVDGLKKAAPAGAGGIADAGTAPPKPGSDSLIARVAAVEAKAEQPAAAAAHVVTDAEPAVSPSAPRGKAPKPRPVRKRFSWRPLVVKLAIGAGVASLVVALQDRLVSGPPRPASEPMTTAKSPPAKSTVAGATTVREPAREARAEATPRSRTADIETRSFAPPAQVAREPATPQPVPPATAAPAPAAMPVTVAAIRLDAHRGPAIGAQFADARSIVTLGNDRVLRSFIFENGTAERTIVIDEATTALAVLGREAAVGEARGTVGVWDLDRTERVATFSVPSGSVSGLAYTAPGRLVVVTDDGGLYAFDRQHPEKPSALFERHEAEIRTLTVHPQGTRFATGATDGTIRAWDLGRPQSLRTMRAGRAAITALAYSPDGRTLAAASADGSLRLWSAASGRLMRVLRGPKSTITALAYAPAGDLLATAWADGTMRLSGTSRWRTLEMFNMPGTNARSVAFSPDGRYVVAAAADGSVLGWSALTGRSREE